MNKLKIGVFSLIFGLLLRSCSKSNVNTQQAENADATEGTDEQGSDPIPPNYGINPNNLPDEVTEQDFHFELGSLETASWLENSKDPGLQIKKLHEEGHTGKGISVAIIDKPIIASSNEFNKDNFTYIQVGKDTRFHFHGMSCASILAGQNCGVAPDVKLYYFAVPDNGKNFDNYSTAIDKIIELNEGLSEKEKIRIVSVSDGLSKDDTHWEKWEKKVRKAADKGILVIYSNNVGDNFVWGGCPPYEDRNDFQNYDIAIALREREIEKKSVIIIPGDYRTVANNQSCDGYTYYGMGGWSWAIPYFAGLCALALEINPQLTYEQMQNALKETKSETESGYYVINPVDYIKKLESPNN